MKNLDLKLQDANDKFKLLKNSISLIGLNRSICAAIQLINNIRNDQEIVDAINRSSDEVKAFENLSKEISIWLSSTLRNNIEPIIKQELNDQNKDNKFSLTYLIAEQNLYSFIPSEDITFIEDVISSAPVLDGGEFSKLDKTINGTMNSSSYIENKDLLLDLLKKIKEISGLPKENLLEFCQIERKIQEDQFSIALIGEFQGGKSTTFDALCGGREISPRGNNIKTSSCKITVTNLTAEKDEYASVIWKSDVELIKTMSPILGAIDAEQLGYDPSTKETFSYCQYVNLSNPSHRELIKYAISVAEDSKNEECKDIILISKFIVEFYERTKTVRESSDYSIEDASKFMTFPIDMEKRYNNSNGDVLSFSDNEALFAFVQTVDCHIHSKELSEMGCSFVDCPGLFASDYDTSIALDTIERSDAVLYLLSGDKQMGQGDNKAIMTIFKSGCIGNPSYKGENVFFAINQRKPLDQTSFVDLDLSQINHIGFEKESLPLYNALLYYYGQFGLSYIENKLDNHTITRFLNSGAKKNASVIEKWVKDVKRMIFLLDIEDVDITDLNIETCKLLIRLSECDTVMNDIKDYAVKNKAYKILIDNGAVKINEGLASIEKALTARESAARMDVAQRAHELENAREKLNDFCERVKQLLSDAFPLKEKKDYIRDVYARYFLEASVVNDIALNVTKNLLDYIRKGSTKWRAITTKIGTSKYKAKQEAKLKADIKVFFESAFNDAISPILEKWLSSHYADKDEDFISDIIPLAEKLAENIKKEWSSVISSTPFLSMLCPSTIDTKVNLKENLNSKVSISQKNVKDDTITETSNMAIGDIVSQIISPIISTVVGLIVFHVLDLIFTGGIAAFYSLIIAALTHLGIRSPKTIYTPDDLGKKGRQLFDKLKANIYDVLLKSEVRETLCFGDKGLITVVDKDVEMYCGFYDNVLSNKRDEFEENVKAAELAYAGQQSNLIRVAEEAKRIRTKEVMPLKKAVNEFISNLS